MVIERHYTEGRQPCDKPNFDVDGNREWFGLSPHECLYCTEAGRDGLVLFCGNCHRDHHKHGWNSCGKGRQEAASPVQ